LPKYKASAAEVKGVRTNLCGTFLQKPRARRQKPEAKSQKPIYLPTY
jgi:hypothetical protein